MEDQKSKNMIPTSRLEWNWRNDLCSWFRIVNFKDLLYCKNWFSWYTARTW